VQRYIVRRLVQSLVVLFGFTVFMFAITFVLPGDPIRGLYGFTPPPPDEYQHLVQHYGLDQPFWVQYARYVSQLFTFDFGESYRAGRSVNTMLFNAAPHSLRLLGIAFLGQIALGVGVTAWALRRKGSILDTAVQLSTLLLVSIPVFVLADVALSLFTKQLHFFPPGGVSGWQSYVLPGAVLAISLAAVMARVARSQLADVAGAPYIATARAMGLSEGRIAMTHQLRPSLGPILTLLAISMSQLVTGLLLVETVFSIPGLGGTVYTAIRNRDRPVILGALFLVTIAVLIANLAADVAMKLADPRITLE